MSGSFLFRAFFSDAFCCLFCLPVVSLCVCARTPGITVYEMIHGRRPFKQWKPSDLTDPSSLMRFGYGVSLECQEFLKAILTMNPEKRLGCGKNKWEEVKQHSWFASLDWDAVRARSIPAPIQPDRDAANCNNSADLADQLMDKDPESIPAEAQKHFVGFEHNTDLKEFTAKQLRDENLAGLNLSTVTELGPSVGVSNASHMIEPAAEAGANGTGGSGSTPVHAAAAAPQTQQGNTLRIPGNAASSTATTAASPAASTAGAPVPTVPSSTLTASSFVATAAAETAVAAPLASINQPAVDIAAVEGAVVPPASGGGQMPGSSSKKYEVAAASSDAAAPSGSLSARSKNGAAAAPLSARRAAGPALNDIPFTRNAVVAQSTPRKVEQQSQIVAAAAQ